MADAKVLLGRAVEWRAPAQAQGLFLEAAQANPLSAEAHLQLGRSLYYRALSAADLESAEASLRQAIDLADGVSEAKGGVSGGEDEDECEDEDGDEGGEEQDEGCDDTGPEARRILARLLCQSPTRRDEAHVLLSELGYTHCLSHALTSYDFLAAATAAVADPSAGQGEQLLGTAAGASDGGDVERPGGGGKCFGYPAASCFDGALPTALLAHLQAALAPAAPFWEEHAYASPSTGFFSYQHELPAWADGDGDGSSGAGSAPRSALEQALLRLRAVAAEAVPAARGARFAEWWAHSRPHSSGHKLHFDYVRDNAAVHGRGGARHPIVSTVTYLTSPCGGPTLVTDQTMPPVDHDSHEGGGGPSASEQRPTKRRRGSPAAPPPPLPSTGRGWAVVPNPNRCLVFNGSLLHCVLPGVGPRPDPAGEAAKADGCDAPPPECSSALDEGKNFLEPRRLTLMVALWETDPRAPTFPTASAAAWPATLSSPLPAPAPGAVGPGEDEPARRNLEAVRAIGRIWEPVETGGKAGKADKAGKSAAKERLDLLSPGCFTDLAALGSGLFLAGASAACSLNCGGTCPVCAAEVAT